MKALMSTSLVVAVLVMIMMNCSPLVGGMMVTMFSAYEELADNIVGYDETGNIQLNGVAADNLLADLGEKSDKVTGFLETKAQDILNVAAEEAEVPEEAAAEFEEMKKTAAGWLDEINEIGKMFTN